MIYIFRYLVHNLVINFLFNEQKSEMAAMEINRAAVVAMNAKVRRTKARLMDEAPKLQKLAQKRVSVFFSFSLHFLLLCF